MIAARPQGSDRLLLRVDAPQRNAHCVETWLCALVEIRTVSAEPAWHSEVA